MSDVKVIRTNGSADELISKSETPCIHLFLTYMSDKIVGHEMGDVLTNTESDRRFALLVRESPSDKLILASLRVSLINLIRHLQANNLMDRTLVISKYEFKGTKEEATFISTMRELLLTQFPIELEDELCIVICDC